MPILKAKGVTRYFGGLAAVSNVDFELRQGEILGLIGPNGAGKTTLFNLISAAMSPRSGSIMFRDREIVGLKPHQICRMGVARTFQTVKVFSNMSALHNVLLGAYFGRQDRMATTDAVSEATALLEFVELAEAAETPAKDLTLASQKRLEVARALATQPKVLLLDELMEGLNPSEVVRAMSLVKRIQERGVTVVMIEHVMRAIMSVCDRIIVLHHGAKIAEGTPEEISANQQVVEVYFGEGTDAANT
ncbi:MAG: ABC transporter ATP-binding protein [Deltaproteobacteria bacterium]|nr:ABC transporter ATP-binding protein [Deltaproteobacteria bacterium]